MRKKKLSLISSAFLVGLFCILGTTVLAQTSPADCKLGCTSNDVQIKSAYLSDINGNKLSSGFVCPQSGTATVYLTLELTTKTPRVGVVIYANIKNFTGGVIGSTIATPSQCFGIALNQPTNKVTFQNSFLWPCGVPIVMTDVFLGWGTGNTNFCTGTGFQCPATSSKCYSLPPGQYIAIETPSAQSASIIQCETTVGGGTSIFNLTSVNGTVSNNANNVTINYWETNNNGTLSNCIPTSSLTAYVSGSKDVYAKVKNSSDSTAYSISTVTLTVVSRPSTLALTGSSICASNPGTGTISSTSSQTGVSYQLQDGSNNNVQSPKTGTGSGLSWTALAAGTSYHVVSTGASPTNCSAGSNSVDVTSVANPVDLSLTGSSICASAPNTGTVSSSSSEAGVSYQLQDGSNNNVQSAKPGTGSGLTWTGLSAGTGYHVVATGAGTTACQGGSNSVGVTSVTNPVDLSLTGSSICASAPNTGTVTSSTSQSGVSYQLKDGSNNSVQSPKTGTGSGLSWTGLAAGTGYHVVATGAGTTACSGGSNSIDVASVANPVDLSLTGSSICASAPNTGTVSSSTSQSGVSYQLKDGSNVNVQAAKAGTGSGLTWTGLAAGTGYHVVATGSGTTACPGGSNSVAVTSVANPVDLALTGSSICSSAPGTGTISSSTSQTSVTYQLKDGANNNVQSAQSGTGSGLTWSNLAVGTSYHVVSTGASPTNCTGSSNNVNVSSITNPTAPAVTYNPPNCDQTTFSITITGVISGASYTVRDKNGANITGISPATTVVAPNTTNLTFSNIPTGSGYQVTVTNSACASTACTCGGTGITAHNNIQPESLSQSETKTTVKAYPNPFSDRINFVVTTPVGGKGNLEVYNIMGQRVKTVYQGYISAGTQNFQLSLPTQQIANLIYVLRIGDKRISGKILQVNN